jgi:hypothetical protein
LEVLRGGRGGGGRLWIWDSGATLKMGWSVLGVISIAMKYFDDGCAYQGPSFTSFSRILLSTCNAQFPRANNITESGSVLTRYDDVPSPPVVSNVTHRLLIRENIISMKPPQGALKSLMPPVDTTLPFPPSLFVFSSSYLTLQKTAVIKLTSLLFLLNITTAGLALNIGDILTISCPTPQVVSDSYL